MWRSHFNISSHPLFVEVAREEEEEAAADILHQQLFLHLISSEQREPPVASDAGEERVSWCCFLVCSSVPTVDPDTLRLELPARLWRSTLRGGASQRSLVEEEMVQRVTLFLDRQFWVPARAMLRLIRPSLEDWECNAGRGVGTSPVFVSPKGMFVFFL